MIVAAVKLAHPRTSHVAFYCCMFVNYRAVSHAKRKHANHGLEENIPKAGYLHKSDPFGKNWKKRYFYLHEGVMKYYKVRACVQSSTFQNKAFAEIPID